MNLLLYLFLLGEVIGLEGFNFGLRESGCKRKRVLRMNFLCVELFFFFFIVFKNKLFFEKLII